MKYRFTGNPLKYSNDYYFKRNQIFTDLWAGSNNDLVNVHSLASMFPLDFEIIKKDTKNEKSLRFNSNKLKWSLLDYPSLESTVKVLEFGCEKYSKDNWKIGLHKDEICDSLMRHLTSVMSGEMLDKESGLSHMGHIICNAMFLEYHSFVKKENKIKNE